jgi:hypothetical protein
LASRYDSGFYRNADLRAPANGKPVCSNSASICANLYFAGSPAGLALSVVEAVIAASGAGMAECSYASRDIIEIHVKPSFHFQ